MLLHCHQHDVIRILDTARRESGVQGRRQRHALLDTMVLLHTMACFAHDKQEHAVGVELDVGPSLLCFV